MSSLVYLMYLKILDLLYPQPSFCSFLILCVLAINLSCWSIIYTSAE